MSGQVATTIAHYTYQSYLINNLISNTEQCLSTSGIYSFLLIISCIYLEEIINQQGAKSYLYMVGPQAAMFWRIMSFRINSRCITLSNSQERDAVSGYHRLPHMHEVHMFMMYLLLTLLLLLY